MAVLGTLSITTRQPSLERADCLRVDPARSCYGEFMSSPRLADPAYEPTDDELRELMHRAMSGARVGREAALHTLREQIAAEKVRAREALALSGTGG